LTTLAVHSTPGLYGELTIAGSKNYTSRYVLAASLAEGISEIVNPAPIDDAIAMARCCRQLGAEVDTTSKSVWRVKGTGGQINGPLILNVANAGAVTRFLIAVSTLSSQPIKLYTEYADSLGKRSHKELIEALNFMGAVAESDRGTLPVTVRRGDLHSGQIQISCQRSSQYLSALLFLTPMLEGTSTIQVADDLKSKPLIRQSLEVFSAVGINIEASRDLFSYSIAGPQKYRAGRYIIPGDWPSAAAILCAAAVAGGDVTLYGLQDDNQGEKRVIEVLVNMGVEVDFDPYKNRVRIVSSGRLKPIEYDGDQATDAVLSMVAAACFAEGTSRFYNIENLRYKESDRISDFCQELKKAGVKVTEEKDAIIVEGSPQPVAGDVTIDPHFDHRILMALTIIGLKARLPILLTDTHHIAKSYPHFFSDLTSLGANLAGEKLDFTDGVLGCP
jgi:3-phosphoshikimate 1-carboxyvinyltransferase